jgi:Xaa-Pro dipeptidase
MSSMTPARIGLGERRQRLGALCAAMDVAGLAAVVLGATASLRYFTGLSWSPSERFTGAIVHVSGTVEYVCPMFELSKVSGIVGVPGEIFTWQEEENPQALIASRLKPGARVALDDHVATFFYLALCAALSPERVVSAGPLINRLRRCKSATELALMTRAKAITLEVQRRARESLRKGVMASEVERFIDEQHRALGADSGNTFCIVAFGSDSALPHGGDSDRALAEDDIVLIDTGCHIDGYNADITRTYVFGEPTKQMRAVWGQEKEAQAIAFAAARLGAPCESVDGAVRDYLRRVGLGPDYRLPGVAHRTGHGIGLDIHEAPNLVRGDATPLEVGMCFSNEPMIIVPEAFGVRLEDHFYMTASGPRWFTEPSLSIDDPFGNAPAFVL